MKMTNHTQREPFSLHAAMAGEPMVFRNGMPVNATFRYHGESLPFAFRLEYVPNEDDAASFYYNAAGRRYEHLEDQYDLFMAIKPFITEKLSNPKDLIGSGKLPIHLWPNTATAYGCLGLLDGMLKYGRSNFRAVGVRASIYYDAARRHLDAWFEGEDSDPDSGLPHLSHALACLAIICDSQAKGNMVDDRMYKGGYRELVTKLTPHVERIKELHSHRNPQHYTITQNKKTLSSVLESFANEDALTVQNNQ